MLTEVKHPDGAKKEAGKEKERETQGEWETTKGRAARSGSSEETARAPYGTLEDVARLTPR